MVVCKRFLPFLYTPILSVTTRRNGDEWEWWKIYMHMSYVCMYLYVFCDFYSEGPVTHGIDTIIKYDWCIEYTLIYFRSRKGQREQEWSSLPQCLTLCLIRCVVMCYVGSCRIFNRSKVEVYGRFCNDANSPDMTHLAGLLEPWIMYICKDLGVGVCMWFWIDWRHRGRNTGRFYMCLIRMDLHENVGRN